MLRLILRLLPGLGIVVGCSPIPEPAIPPLVDAESRYELRFNDTHVADVFFAVEFSAADGRYRIDSLTESAPSLQDEESQEIVESSAGRLLGDRVRPERFDHSTRLGEQLQILNLAFDWDAGQLRLTNAERTETIGLLPDTQDRLSYLLVARQLAAAGAGDRSLRIATPGGAEQASLETIAARRLELPAGDFTAIGVRRSNTESATTRELWFAPEVTPLPLMLTHTQGDSRVDMLLSGYRTRGPAGNDALRATELTGQRANDPR